jgi:hypothetical protein
MHGSSLNKRCRQQKNSRQTERKADTTVISPIKANYPVLGAQKAGIESNAKHNNTNCIWLDVKKAHIAQHVNCFVMRHTVIIRFTR